MANDGAEARLAGRFPPGTKVSLYRGRVDTVAAGDAPFKTATVDDQGEVKFTGLDDDERLIIAGYVEENRPLGGGQWATEPKWRSVVIHASIPEPERKPDSDKKIAQALQSTLSPHELEPDRTTVGARGTRSLSRGGQPFASQQAGKPTPEGAPAERVPHLRQEDARDVEQRSATFTGQATPVDPGEQVPKPAADPDADLEQRSATASGELTPIVSGEQTPVPQDPEADVEQRVAGDTGTQFPVPQGDPVDIQRRKESSAAKAEGAVQPPVDYNDTKPSDAELGDLTADELHERAAELDIAGRSSMNKAELVAAIKKEQG